MGERSTDAMILVDLFDLLYMEDFFLVSLQLIIKMEFLSFSSISIPCLIAILSAHFAKTSILVLFLVF
jgi:hypothetical protein